MQYAMPVVVAVERRGAARGDDHRTSAKAGLGVGGGEKKKEGEGGFETNKKRHDKLSYPGNFNRRINQSANQQK